MLPESIRVTLPITSLKGYILALAKLWERHGHEALPRAPEIYRHQIFIGDVYNELLDAQERFVYRLTDREPPVLTPEGDKALRMSSLTYSFEPKHRMMHLKHDGKTLSMFIPPK